MSRIFLICPVRNVDYTLKETIEGYVSLLENYGHIVHYPPRDTNQIDDTGLNICKENSQAIVDSDEVHVIWDGKSQGVLFDVGVAFALGKAIIPMLLPPQSKGKSFQNMLLALAKEQKKTKEYF